MHSVAIAITLLPLTSNILLQINLTHQMAILLGAGSEGGERYISCLCFYKVRNLKFSHPLRASVIQIYTVCGFYITTNFFVTGKFLIDKRKETQPKKLNRPQRKNVSCNPIPTRELCSKARTSCQRPARCRRRTRSAFNDQSVISS